MTGAQAAQQWQLGIGDLAFLGWFTIGCYILGATLAAVAVVVARRARREIAGVDAEEAANQAVLARVWFVVAVALVLLGLDKLLDLQTGIALRMRSIAYEDGWYGRRRELQAPLIAAVVVLGAVLTAALAVGLRRVVRRIALVVAGVVALLVFAVVSAISFHYVDAVLDLGGSNGVGALAELAGIVVVVVATVQWHFAERRIVGSAIADGAGWAGRLPASPQNPVSIR